MLDQSVSETLDVDRRRSTEFIFGATDEGSRPQWAASRFAKNGTAPPPIPHIGFKFDANALPRFKLVSHYLASCGGFRHLNSDTILLR
jgi:hypothetical protein